MGFAVGRGQVGGDNFAFGVADMTGSGGRVVTAGTKAFVGDGAGIRPGVGVGAFGVAVLGAGAFGLGVDVAGCARTGAARTGTGVAPGPLTVVEDPAGTDTSTPPALVSTVPEIVTTVVSPSGETITYESEPARITDAMPVLRTS